MDLKQLESQVKSILKNTRTLYFLEQENHFKHLDIKGLNQLVTEMDVKVENYLKEELLKIIPSDFLAEESGDQSSGKTYRWIIDPIDGTTNFVHQVPVFSISIALQRDDKTIAGFVHELSRDEIFFASEDTPAHCNTTPIFVSATSEIENTLMATGFPYYKFDNVGRFYSILHQCITHTRGVRRLGSAAVDLAYVACGKNDGFYEFDLSPWDVAAGAYIVERAGGKVTDFANDNNYIFGGEILAATKSSHKWLLDIINKSEHGKWIIPEFPK